MMFCGTMAHVLQFAATADEGVLYTRSCIDPQIR